MLYAGTQGPWCFGLNLDSENGGSSSGEGHIEFHCEWGSLVGNPWSLLNRELALRWA